MNSISGNQKSIFHTLDLYIHGSTHAGQHTLDLVQGNHSGVCTVGCGFVNFRHHTGEDFICNGADSDIGGLLQFQRENITFVNADGDRHTDIGGEGQQISDGIIFFQILQIRHIKDAAADRGGDATVLLDVQQFQQSFLSLPSVPEQGIIGGAESSVLQGKDVGIFGKQSVLLDVYGADGTGISGDHQRAVDIEFCTAQFLAGCGLDSDIFTIFRTVIGDQNGCGVLDQGLHTAADLRAVGTDNDDGISVCQSFGFQIQGHIPIQGQNRQGAVLHHGVSDTAARLTINDLDTAGDAGGDTGAGFVVIGIIDLIIQFVDLILKIRQGGTDSGQVCGGQKLTSFHGLTVFHQDLRQFYAIGNGNCLGIYIGQNATAGNQGADGTCFHGMGQNICVRGCEFLAHLPLQDGHARYQCKGQYQNDNDHSTDDFPALLLLGFAQGFEERIVPCFQFLHAAFRLRGDVVMVIHI